MTIDDYLRTYTAGLRDAGAIQTPAVEHAFRTVRRHHCVTGFYRSSHDRVEVPQDELPPPDVLDLIYGDNALLTRLPGPDFTLASSSSLPSLMARMLEALELQPGQHVLEVAAGTGYNAALIATITQAPVVSIDVQDDVVREAQAAMRRLGMDNVTIRCADGYTGHPDATPYHRIIVTVACTGLSPRWIDQLAHDGLIIAPIAIGGAHPILAVRSHRGHLTGRPVLWTDFMRARGPLYQWPYTDRPLLSEPVTATDLTEHHDVIPPLNENEYIDLRFFMSIHDHRITEAVALNVNRDITKGRCTLLDPECGAAFIKTDSIVLAGDPSLLHDIKRLHDEWERLERPRLGDWQCKMVATGDPATPILVPTEWHRRVNR